MPAGADPGTSSEPEAPEGAASRLLLQSIFTATLHEDCWLRIMAALAPAIGTGKVILFEVDRVCPSESRTDAIGLDPAILQRLRERNVEDDTLWQAMVRLPEGSVFRSPELMGIEKRDTHPMFHEIGVPGGLRFLMGAVLENTPMFFTDVSFARHDRNFSDCEKQTLVALVPALQNALRVSRRIALGDAGRREALRNFDRVGQAVVVLDRSGYAIYSNAHAEELFGAGDGLSLKFGRFHFEDITLQAEFERLARLALETPSGETSARPQEVRHPRKNGSGQYGLSILPVIRSSDRALLPDGAAAMVLIYDPAGLRLPLPLQRLSWFYDLTPAEARICEGLYRTGSSEAAAQDLNVTQHTVRSHLKTIYAKIGVATQAQLMQRLTHSALLESPIDNLSG